jgi:hypothetical protein
VDVCVSERKNKEKERKGGYEWIAKYLAVSSIFKLSINLCIV